MDGCFYPCFFLEGLLAVTFKVAKTTFECFHTIQSKIWLKLPSTSAFNESGLWYLALCHSIPEKGRIIRMNAAMLWQIANICIVFFVSPSLLSQQGVILILHFGCCSEIASSLYKKCTFILTVDQNMRLATIAYQHGFDLMFVNSFPLKN